MSDELPSTWATAPLDSLCERLRGVSYTRDEASAVPMKGFLPILRANNIENDRLTFEDLVYVPTRRITDAQRIRKGDVVIAMSSGSKSVVGKTAQATMDWEGAFGAFCGVLRASSELNPRYIGLFLRTRDYRHRISELAAGTNINNLKAEHFSEIELPLAPLSEQRRIVAKLERLLGKVDACQQRLAKVPVLLKRFRQSVLAAACCGRLTANWRQENPEAEPQGILKRLADESGTPLAKAKTSEMPFEIPSTWECIQAQDLCRPSQVITYGVLKPVWVKDGVPTVRVQDMQQGKIAVGGVGRCCPEREKKFTKTTLEEGDLLIAKDGATLGKTAFVPTELVGGNITQHVLRFPVSRLVESVYIRLIIDSRYGQEWMRLETKGVALPGVNVGDFRRIPLPMPPLAEQQEIVRRVEALFTLADQLEARYTKAKTHVEKLTPSILAKAFRGELVPQDPNDEPVEKLLELLNRPTQKAKQRNETRRG